MRFLLVFLISINSYAMSFNQAKIVYQRLAIANGIKAPLLTLNNSNEVNAEATLFTISINKGMLGFVRNADELAMILGHELGHFTARHTGSTPSRELMADSLGAKYSDRAGYNHCRGVLVLLRFNSPVSSTHPASIDRYNRLRCSKYE